jgi:LmbE family N-acetylglucosaminyl deacetylase
VLGLTLARDSEAPLRVLAIGAHADDIEIGCGGTLLRLVAEHPGVAVDWVMLSGIGKRGDEAVDSATTFLEGVADLRITVERFRDGFFPYEGAAVKELFERLKSEVTPDVTFTHRLEDRHQDHRLVGELTWNTFRDHLILEYEIPKYDPDLGNPNLFLPLERGVAKAKVAALMTHFASQRRRGWFTPDTFMGLLRLRGVQCAASTGLAEGFFAHKLVV